MTGDHAHDLRRYGAVGDGIHDDTRAWAAMLAAVPPGGARLMIPPGIWTTSRTLALPSNCAVEGVWAGNSDQGSGATTGSVVKWTGGSGAGPDNQAAVVTIFGAAYVAVDGLIIDMNDADHCAGIRIDSDDTPQTTHSWTLDRMTIWGGSNIEYARADTVGIQIGTRGIHGHQCDTGALRNVDISMVNTGMIIDSANAQQGGVFEQLRLTYVVTGVRLKTHTFHVFRSCIAGFEPTVLGTFFEVAGPGDALLIQQTQCEGGLPGTTHLHVTAEATADSAHPITLLSNHFDRDVIIDNYRLLACEGNTWREGVSCYLNADNVPVVSIQEGAIFDPYLLNGTNTRVTYLTGDGLRTRGVT
jgi:hypothetical protein